jgi:hypothetical protein
MHMRFAKLILVLMFTFVMGAAASTAVLSQPAPPDNGFAPGLLFAVVLIGAVFLVLIGIGIVIGLACLTCAAIFIALGIISTSALVALFLQRFSTGLRALHYQLSGLVGLPCGIGILWLGCSLFDVHIRHRYILVIGSVIGVIAGIIIAFILDQFFRFVYRRFIQASGLRVST